MNVIVQNTIKDLLFAAIDEFYIKDDYLIKNEVHERCCVARIAHYLQNLLDKYDIFNTLSVDLEYNRQTDEKPKTLYKKQIKKSECKEQSIYPDLIVHQRGINKQNILVAEFKIACRMAETNKKYDIIKIRSLKKEKNYKLGFFISLDKKSYNYEKIN